MDFLKLIVSWLCYDLVLYMCLAWFCMECLIDTIVLVVDDLKANTEYTGYTAASSVVQWFWEVVKGFNKEDMARLLQFVTGTSKVICWIVNTATLGNALYLCADWLFVLRVTSFWPVGFDLLLGCSG